MLILKSGSMSFKQASTSLRSNAENALRRILASPIGNLKT